MSENKVLKKIYTPILDRAEEVFRIIKSMKQSGHNNSTILRDLQGENNAFVNSYIMVVQMMIEENYFDRKVMEKWLDHISDKVIKMEQEKLEGKHRGTNNDRLLFLENQTDYYIRLIRKKYHNRHYNSEFYNKLRQKMLDNLIEEDKKSYEALKKADVEAKRRTEENKERLKKYIIENYA